MATQAELQQAVEREIARYHGSLDLAVEALRHDADAAPWGSPVHEILNAALAEQSARKAQAQRKAAA